MIDCAPGRPTTDTKHHPHPRTVNNNKHQQLRRRLQGAKAGCGSFLSALWTTVKRSLSPGRVPMPVERRKYNERATRITSFVIQPPELKARFSSLLVCVIVGYCVCLMAPRAEANRFPCLRPSPLIH